MAKKGTKFSAKLGEVAEDMVDRLTSLGPVTWKKCSAVLAFSWTERCSPW